MEIKIETRGLKHDDTVTKFTIRLGSAAAKEEFTAVENLLWEAEQELQHHITTKREETLDRVATLQNALVEVRDS